jgi:F-type H+-transporting ATPase subunit alpha
MFASDLDPASKAQLARGARLVELLKQKQASPLPVEEQVVSIWAGTTGQLDSIPVEDVQRFEAEFLDHLRRSKGDLLAAIRETGKFEDSTEEALTKEIDSFKKGFSAEGSNGMVAGNEAEEGAADMSLDSDQEQIVKQKR